MGGGLACARHRGIIQLNPANHFKRNNEREYSLHNSVCRESVEGERVWLCQSHRHHTTRLRDRFQTWAPKGPIQTSTQQHVHAASREGAGTALPDAAASYTPLPRPTSNVNSRRRPNSRTTACGGRNDGESEHGGVRHRGIMHSTKRRGGGHGCARHRGVIPPTPAALFKQDPLRASYVPVHNYGGGSE